MYRNYSLKVLLLTLLIVCPVFLSMSFSGGLRLDADPFNNLGAPSLPLSIIFCSVFMLTHLKHLKLKNRDAVFLCLIAFFVVFNVLFGSGFRAVIVGFSIIFFVLNYSFWRGYLSGISTDSLLRGFYLGLSFLLFVKLTTDLLLLGEMFSKYFVLQSIVIYNYYDYFPFVYMVLFVVSLQFLFSKKYYALSMFNIAHSLLFLSESPSRLFFYGTFIAAALFFSRMIVRIKFNIFYYFSLCVVVAGTVTAAIFYAHEVSDLSLSERFLHWNHFLGAMDVYSLFLPFLNEYRVTLVSGSLHNEFLEIFSFFGLLFFVFLNNIKHYVCSSSPLVYDSLYVLTVVLIFGMLIQLNMTNPYIVVFFSFFLAVASNKEVLNGID